MHSNKPILAIVVPCYNEQQTLLWSAERLSQKLTELIQAELIDDSSFIYLIDDGSEDQTWSLIEQANQQYSHLYGLKLAANVGHQNALSAGLHQVTGICDCCISIDADLQHDLAAITGMLEHYRQGNHMVFGVRDKHIDRGFAKQFCARAYYRLLHLMGIKCIANHADFRLLSNTVLSVFKQMPEQNLYLRGIFASLAFKSTIISYREYPRQYGKSKYTLSKMLTLAWNGISGFSVVPLRFIALVGAITFLVTLVLIGYVLIIKGFTDLATPGWASTVIPIYLLGGLQLLALGVTGEYIGKIFTEIKHRPRYIIEKIIPTKLDTP